jgi:hypothetical protein
VVLDKVAIVDILAAAEINLDAQVNHLPSNAANQA